MKLLNDFIKTMDFNYFSSGQHKISPEKLFADADAIFLDVRSNEENDSVKFDLKYQITSLHIPSEKIPEHLNKIPKDKLIGIFCPAGVRATIVFVYLSVAGYKNVKIIEGGYNAVTSELKPGKVRKQINAEVK